MKETSVHMKNMWIKQLCNYNHVWDFAMAFLVWKRFGTFEKLASGQGHQITLCSWAGHFTLLVVHSTQVYTWVPGNLILGVTLRWTSIPSKGSRNTSCHFVQLKQETSAGLMGHLSHNNAGFTIMLIILRFSNEKKKKLSSLGAHWLKKLPELVPVSVAWSS